MVLLVIAVMDFHAWLDLGTALGMPSRAPSTDSFIQPFYYY